MAPKNKTPRFHGPLLHAEDIDPSELGEEADALADPGPEQILAFLFRDPAGTPPRYAMRRIRRVLSDDYTLLLDGLRWHQRLARGDRIDVCDGLSPRGILSPLQEAILARRLASDSARVQGLDSQRLIGTSLRVSQQCVSREIRKALAQCERLVPLLGNRSARVSQGARSRILPKRPMEVIFARFVRAQAKAQGRSPDEALLHILLEPDTRLCLNQRCLTPFRLGSRDAEGRHVTQAREYCSPACRKDRALRGRVVPMAERARQKEQREKQWREVNKRTKISKILYNRSRGRPLPASAIDLLLTSEKDLLGTLLVNRICRLKS